MKNELEKGNHLEGEEESFFPDITRLIRSIQRSEGNLDCFRRRSGHCTELDCAWRLYCLGNHGDSERG